MLSSTRVDIRIHDVSVYGYMIHRYPHRMVGSALALAPGLGPSIRLSKTASQASSLINHQPHSPTVTRYSAPPPVGLPRLRRPLASASPWLK